MGRSNCGVLINFSQSMINPPDPIIESIDGDHYLLREAFTVKFGFWLRELQFEIPAGFISDLASIPRCFRWIHDRASLGVLAPVVHDFLCHTNGRFFNVQGEPVQLHWFDVHLFFLVSMRIDGVSWGRALIAFLVVVCFGTKWRNR